MSFEQVPSYLWHYAQNQPSLADAAAETKRFLEDLALEGAIDTHLVEARPKTFDSYRTKSEKTREDGTPKYLDPAKEIHDCVAARVIVYTTRARNDLAGLIVSSCPYLERENPGEKRNNGYDSEHIVISGIHDEAVLRRFPALVAYFDQYQGLEIQVRSVAGHAWAEYEHDVRYKAEAYRTLSEREKRRVDQLFVEAGGMRRYMDKIFDEIEERLRPQAAVEAGSADEPVLSEDEPPTEALDPTPIDADTLSAFIAARFPRDEPGDPWSIHELVDHLAALEVTTVGELEEVLANLDTGQVARLMDYPTETSGVRRLDDELLAVFLDRYVKAAAPGRWSLLSLRLRRVRGQFTIYSLEDADGMRRPVAAARALRDVVRFVAAREGIAATIIDGAIATDRLHVPSGWAPKKVETSNGPVYVATNLTRASAESLMGQLVSRVPGSGLRIKRAGDLLFESPPA
ncbi:hypothetical protein KOI35_22420 [Actinoplanes bogorensis]|uniref:RelA/SpoT domain-containing protein n=1 Tax=Paractinoplanes bogorensis TaxID=1610840 RepID=A0ABS5YT61_9ACTN|nr:hypothetical protein [Actinoplanes bogorensis]MBU2666261.1 hypothetical protein [Actinoplanes bogorensis]